jgi:chromosome segregation ATPase
MNKTALNSKSRMSSSKVGQTQKRLSNTLIDKNQPPRKPTFEELDKEMIDPSQVAIKEMVEKASVEQRAISMIDDTLYLFNNKGEGKGARIEKYELINKEEFENMKADIEKYKQKAKDLKEEYRIKKEEYEKVSNELNNHNYKYYNTEKAKTDSITKLYSLELKLKQIIVNNSKLQNEIHKEVEGKNNIFRALNEFKRKYNKIIHPELRELFSKIKEDQFNPINVVPQSDKIGNLEDKLESLKKELESKENRIEMLKNTIEENNVK